MRLPKCSGHVVLSMCCKRMLMGPYFTMFRVAAEVDGGEGLEVAVALPVPLSDLDLGELASVELPEFGDAIVFSLS